MKHNDLDEFGDQHVSLFSCELNSLSFLNNSSNTHPSLYSPEILLEHYTELPLYLGDSCIEMQKKAIEVFMALLEKSMLTADKTMQDVIETIVDKCLTIDKATECLLFVAKKEDTRAILKQILIERLIQVKNVKVVLQLLSTLGNKYCPVREFVCYILKLVELEDIKDMVFSYLKEAYKWDKRTLLRSIEELAEAQKEEIRKQLVGSEEQKEITNTLENNNRYMNLLKDPKNKPKLLKELAKKIKEDKTIPKELTKVIKELIQDLDPGISNKALQIFGQLLKSHKEPRLDVVKVILGKCTEESTAVNARNCLRKLILLLKTEEVIECLKDVLNNSNNLVISELCLCITNTIPPNSDSVLLKAIEKELELSLKVLENEDSIEIRKIIIDYLNSIKVHNKPEDNPKICENNEGDLNFEVYKNQETREEARLELEREYKKLLEEDKGQAITACEATKQVFEVIPTDILAQFDMNEWSEREKGLQDLNNWINKNADKGKKKLIEALVLWLKRKFGDLKILNNEVTKELLTLFKTLSNKCEFCASFAFEIVPALIIQMSDKELSNECVEIITLMTKSIAIPYMSGLVIKICYESKAIKEGLLILNKVLKLNTPAKLILLYAKECLANKDITIRKEAIQCIISLYKLKGQQILPLLSDITEEAYKVIEKALSKVEGTYRTDITAQLTQKIITGLSAPLSKHRQEAKNEIEKIIENAGNIESVGLTHLFIALKGRMKEPCKNLLRGFITLIGNLAVAMGEGFQQYTKIILQPLMQNLLDKQSMIRNEALMTVEKTYSAIGLEPILNNIAKLLIADTHSGKTGILTWIQKHKEELIKHDLHELVESLAYTIQDKSKEVRELTDTLIKDIKTQLGDKEFNNLFKDSNKALKVNLLQDTKGNGEVRVELEGSMRIKNRSRLNDVCNYKSNTKSKLKSPLEVSSYESLNNTPVKSNESKIKLGNSYVIGTHLSLRNGARKNQKARENCRSCNFMRSKSNIRRAALDSSIVSNGSSRELSQTRKFEGMVNSKSTNDLQEQFQARLKTRLTEGKRVMQKKGKDSLSESTPDNTTDNVIIATLGNKAKRAEQDKKFKWPINEVRSVNVEKLKKTLKNCINQNVFERMFSAQFKKNLSAINAFNEALKNEFPSLLDLLDLVFKWIAIKLIDQPNVSMTKEILEFLQSLFNKLKETEYHLLDFEASAIIPLLCEKLGLTNITFRQQFRELLRTSTQLYSPSKITNYLTSTLETTNNKRTKIECLKLTKEFIKKYETAKCLTPKDVRSIIKLINSSENDLKNDGLDIMAELYNHRGDSLWVLVGQLTEKTDELLKKRLNIDDSTSIRKEKGSISDDLFMEICDSRVSQRKSTNKHNAQKLESSIRKSSIERDNKLLISPMAEHMSPSETESVFSTTGKLEENYKTSRIQISIDSSQVQEEEIIEVENLEQALDILKNGSITKRVNALMYLNEKTISTLEEEKECLIKHSDQLIVTFADILRELFDKPMEDIPVRFTKYFMTVVSKVCANKNVMQHVTEKCLYAFIEQILMKLLYDNLESMGDNNEGQYLVKALNLTILRVLEMYDPTKLFSIFIHLFVKYKDIAIINIKTAKLPSLIAKCTLKLAKSMLNISEHLNVGKILVTLHEYLLLIPPSAIPKSANDDIGIRMAKTVVYELIKIRGESIWGDYKLVQQHKKPDLHLQRWINLILGSFHSASFSPIKSCEESEADGFDELQIICQGLNSQETFQKSIQRLSEYSRSHQNLDLEQYFANYSKPFREFILSSLERYNNKPKVTPFESRNVNNTPKNSNSSVSEYKNKLEFLKQKFDIGSKEDRERKFLAPMNSMLC